ncbi:MAG: hypothetical protein ABI959_05060 [Candidatus Dormiibacterota bacterium]
MNKALTVAVAAFALIACGQGGGGAAVPTPISPPTGALVKWTSFPADQKPRPIVWLQNSSPADGYGTGEAKMAAYCNKYVVGSALPTAVPSRTVARWSDGTSATYRGIPAVAALAALAADKTHQQDPQCSPIPPLVLNAARLGTFDFVTDRGKAQMTSWLFSAIGVSGELAYPAIDPSAFWTGSIISQYGGAAIVVSGDGLSLTYTFYGAPSNPGPCGAEYKGVVAESKGAVAVALQETPHAQPGQPVACDAMAQQRTVVVVLAQPLGGRVVVDSTGNVNPVCPSTKPDC